MTIPSLLQPFKLNQDTIKEFQLLVKDAPVVPPQNAGYSDDRAGCPILHTKGNSLLALGIAFKPSNV